MTVVGGAWKRMKRVNGSDAGRMRRMVYVCEGCGLWHYDKKPAQCQACGRLDFSRFDSIGEAKQWARYQLLQRAGEISDLRRQVKLDLLTVGPKGLPCVWGHMLVDFAFKEKGVQRYSDYKPVEGPSPDAVLKIRCLESQGIIVSIVTSKGEA